MCVCSFTISLDSRPLDFLELCLFIVFIYELFVSHLISLFSIIKPSLCMYIQDCEAKKNKETKNTIKLHLFPVLVFKHKV